MSENTLNRANNEKGIDRIIRKPAMIDLTGLSNTTLWRLEKAGKFPKRITIGGKACGWLMSEFQQWLREKSLERNQDHKPEVTQSCLR